MKGRGQILIFSLAKKRGLVWPGKKRDKRQNEGEKKSNCKRGLGHINYTSGAPKDTVGERKKKKMGKGRAGKRKRSSKWGIIGRGGGKLVTKKLLRRRGRKKRGGRRGSWGEKGGGKGNGRGKKELGGMVLGRASRPAAWGERQKKRGKRRCTGV